jgi:hypothetical protein
MKEILLVSAGFLLATICGTAIALLLYNQSDHAAALTVGTLAAYAVGGGFYWFVFHKKNAGSPGEYAQTHQTKREEQLTHR